MKPLTLFLFDPSNEEIKVALSKGRVAAVFTDTAIRKQARLSFNQAVRDGELIDLDEEILHPFLSIVPEQLKSSFKKTYNLSHAALLLLGVPYQVNVTAEDAFWNVADVLRQQAHSPEHFRFKGWSEAHRAELLRLGYTDVAAEGGADVMPAPDEQHYTPERKDSMNPFKGCVFHAWR